MKEKNSLKFRAWDKTTNQMRACYGFNTMEQEVYVCSVANDEFTGRPKTVHAIRRIFDEVVLMQSTGLKDKNGVEIFEGDIVHWMTEFISPMDMRTKLKIDSNKEVYQKESGEWGMGEVGNTLSEEQLNVEVIGNIYKNVELLEVAE